MAHRQADFSDGHTHHTQQDPGIRDPAFLPTIAESEARRDFCCKPESCATPRRTSEHKPRDPRNPCSVFVSRDTMIALENKRLAALAMRGAMRKRL